MDECLESLLAPAQARFLRAIEALARVRRLARNTPALQINVQGGVNGYSADAGARQALSGAPSDARTR